MITLTDAAREKIVELMAQHEDKGLAVRLEITGRRSSSFIYMFGFFNEENKKDGDLVLDMGDFRVYVDAKSAPHLEGTTIDITDLGGGRFGFGIDNPNSVWDDPVAEKVAQVIDSEINPGVAMHGGIIMLEDVKDGVAYVRMGGGCQGCGLASVTLTQGIITAIRSAVPEVREVVDVTHHAAGVNPYYRSPGDGQSPGD